MKDFAKRLIAYLTGNLRVAEGLSDMAKVPSVPWITDSAQTDAAADFALESAQRAATDANASTKAVQDKAGSLMTIILTLFPLAVAVTVLVVPAKAGESGSSLVALVLMMLADFLLACAAVFAFLASGLVFLGGWNPSKVKGGEKATLAQIKAEEADAWYFASEVAMWSGKKKADDLFTARRFVVGALIFAVLAAPFLYVAQGNAVQTVHPTPHPHASVSTHA
jgi:hypothetical protein